ncbi:MAG: hypothetical protein L3K03_03865 [Thermoplasmata archaeon]|nr:hypothetical protein [Thermoplasmata archaeon]
MSRSSASGITRDDVDRLIAREHEAESVINPDPGNGLGGIMGLLWESMAADERKHDALLERLRTPEMLGETGAPSPLWRLARTSARTLAVGPG